MWTTGWRDGVWSEMDRTWDVIVIGGGVTGAGIFRKASQAGLRTLLLEAGDFASGSSSRSSKLVHGGLRYLRSGQLKTTYDSVKGRDALLREGQGLITPLPFLFTIFSGDKVPLWQFGLGLAVYDLIGLRWRHQRCSPEALLERVPSLNRAGLVGGYRYLDAETDDARLVLRLIREGVRGGALALNYARVERLLRSRSGRVRGVAVRDMAPDGKGLTAEVQAAVIINATGADADVLRGQLARPARLRRLRGSHLVFSHRCLPLNVAVSFSHPVDGRPVFTIPWEGMTLFGTTDVVHDPAGDREPAISPAEVDYLLSGLDRAFPSLSLSEDDVLATFAGVRAVIDTGRPNPSREARDHAVWLEDGLVSVTGGKLTTFPVIVEDALRAARPLLDSKAPANGGGVLNKPEAFMLPPNLDPSLALRLSGRHGKETSVLLASARPGDLARVENTLSVVAELRWAARAEGVVHLDDLLLRRVRLGLTTPEGAAGLLDQIRPVVQPELGWSDDRWQEETGRYGRLWRKSYYLPA